MPGQRTAAEIRFAARLEQAAKTLARRQVVARAREAVLPKPVAANDEDPKAA